MTIGLATNRFIDRADSARDRAAGKQAAAQRTGSVRRDRAWSAMSRVGPAVRLAAAERRGSDRIPSTGRTTARRVDHALFARRMPYVSLDLTDISAGGLAASSDVELSLGETLAITLPASGTRVIGTVLRCEPVSGDTEVYRVGIEFVSNAAA